MNMTYRPSAEQKKEQRQYEISNAVSTLQRAEQIKKDPALMREVRKQVSAMSKAVGNTRSPKKKK